MNNHNYVINSDMITSHSDEKPLLTPLHCDVIQFCWVIVPNEGK